METGRLLAGLRVIECSMLGPGAATTPFADLGADVIKVEPPGGDYVRKMAWPWVNGVSLLHLHISRGKRSIVLDLRQADGRQAFLDLVANADAVLEAMRPGGLARRGLGYEVLAAVNPRIVLCTLSGYGMTGPYRELPSHGIAYDTWAGVVAPERSAEGMPAIPNHTSIGINAGPLYAALGMLSAVLRARETGHGCHVEVGQSDAAACFDWLRSEGTRAYLRPEDEVTGNASDGFVRRPPGTDGMQDAVRYQFYESSDGHILFMASEQHFWKNFCAAVGRDDLYTAHPGNALADHARGEVALRAQLVDIFRTRPTAAWVELGLSHDVPIAPVNTPATIADDPHFHERLPWQPASRLGADQLPFPVRVVGEQPVSAERGAPTAGQDTESVLRDVAGYDDAQIAALRAAGVTS
ncbi:CaiB/BaiF CoA-transferase family protein [Humibacter sp.]|uniref:CaiB/BaiF CoA transferase family protein n=1 Tax=Humibacter sp. TaxID=1940291 RepID=UPI002B845A8B|nr:CaiB/BaiF CoA-transferase family protein [Humibacter sp.]HVX09159.1 CaiB/BaiF CoA-transferase family protein [Humibacter sp.]